MAFQYSRRIYLGDTDAAGVVYFARGMEICHEAYEESLIKSGINLKQMLAAKKIALPIVSAEINFLRPLFCGDRVTVNLTADLINSSEFIVDYQIFKATNSEQVIITAKTKHVCINPHQRSRLDLSPLIINWLENS